MPINWYNRMTRLINHLNSTRTIVFLDHKLLNSNEYSYLFYYPQNIINENISYSPIIF